MSSTAATADRSLVGPARCPSMLLVVTELLRRRGALPSTPVLRAQVRCLSASALSVARISNLEEPRDKRVTAFESHSPRGAEGRPIIPAAERPSDQPAWKLRTVSPLSALHRRSGAPIATFPATLEGSEATRKSLRRDPGCLPARRPGCLLSVDGSQVATWTDDPVAAGGLGFVEALVDSGEHVPRSFPRLPASSRLRRSGSADRPSHRPGRIRDRRARRGAHSPGGRPVRRPSGETR